MRECSNYFTESPSFNFRGTIAFIQVAAVANIMIIPTSLFLQYRETNLETHRIPCPPAKHLQEQLPPLHIKDYMIRLDGKDGAVEKHTAYMDQFILVRLVELEAVMNEYLCSPQQNSTWQTCCLEEQPILVTMQHLQVLKV